jgi:hypothetical protein
VLVGGLAFSGGDDMSKRTVEIDDDLQERIDTACEEVKAYAIERMKEDELDEAPDFGDLDYSGQVHQIVDSSVPVYYSQIDGLWFLYSKKFEEAYKNAGIGDNPRENDGMTAIYFYIWEQVAEWYESNREDITVDE